MRRWATDVCLKCPAMAGYEIIVPFYAVGTIATIIITTHPYPTVILILIITSTSYPCFTRKA